MFWKQFFTPVKNMGADEVKDFMDARKEGAYTLLDVRQPSEYEGQHIPGAKLIPLTELPNRLGELDAEKPVIVY